MSFIDKARSILDTAQAVLQGEPLRAIIYGGAAVVYLLGRYTGIIDPLSVEEAIVQVTAAMAIVVSLVESARRFVTPVSKG